MALYNDIVMEHFLNPKNVGEMKNPDGTGVYGSPVCGDMMQIQIKVENDVITDAKFKTFGCGSAIASSSMATSMIIGKTIEEALEVTNKQIIDELRKVVTPTRKQLFYWSLAVFIFVALLMVFVTAMDFGLGKLSFLIFG